MSYCNVFWELYHCILLKKKCISCIVIIVSSVVTFLRVLWVIAVCPITSKKCRNTPTVVLGVKLTSKGDKTSDRVLPRCISLPDKNSVMQQTPDAVTYIWSSFSPSVVFLSAAWLFCLTPMILCVYMYSISSSMFCFVFPRSQKWIKHNIPSFKLFWTLCRAALSHGIFFKSSSSTCFWVKWILYAFISQLEKQLW